MDVSEKMPNVVVNKIVLKDIKRFWNLFFILVLEIEKMSRRSKCTRFEHTRISNANFARLQSIQNSLAHVVTNKLKYDHITPSLKSLHWPLSNIDLILKF
jgi:hypothetical protein